MSLKDLSVEELKELLKQKYKEQALVLEEKIVLQLKLLAAAGMENVPERPSYMELMSDTLDSTMVRQDVHLAVKVWMDVLSGATNLSGDVSLPASAKIPPQSASINSSHPLTFLSLVLGKIENNASAEEEQNALFLDLVKRIINSETGGTDDDFKCLVSLPCKSSEDLEALEEWAKAEESNRSIGLPEKVCIPRAQSAGED